MQCRPGICQFLLEGSSGQPEKFSFPTFFVALTHKLLPQYALMCSRAPELSDAKETS